MSKRPHKQSTAHPDDAAQPITFNSISKWQEIEEVPGLTLVDIYRKPRKEDFDPNDPVTIKLKVFYGAFIAKIAFVRTIRKN